MTDIKAMKPHNFRRGDKVLHIMEDEEEMVGTVMSELPNGNYLVEFWVPGRKRGGYRIELEFSADEIIPCYILSGPCKSRSA